MAPLKRNEVKKRMSVVECKRPNSLKSCKQASMVKSLPEMRHRTPCRPENSIEDLLVQHLTDIKNAYSKPAARTKSIHPIATDHDLMKSKIYQAVSTALDYGCAHDVLEKQGQYYCLRNRCVQHCYPGETRQYGQRLYCPNCLAVERN